MPGSHGTLCINSFYPETELLKLPTPKQGFAP